MKRLVLLLKGACMGLADVVPGVSGGTVALVLGIYVQFINALRSFNLRWVAGLSVWARSGFEGRKRHHFLDPILAIHWGFLLPLAMGIGAAIIVGSRVIPPLMEAEPEAMFSFFFGLILASVILPWLQMNRRGAAEIATIAVFAVAAFFLVGAHAQPALSWTSIQTSQQSTLEDLARDHASAWTPQQLFCQPGGTFGNRELRAAIAAVDAPRTDSLLELCASLEGATSARELQTLHDEHHLARKDPANPFNQILVPANTPLDVPRPAIWFMFLAGLIAVSAMLLPGISGSFILLVLGAYYFILVSLKGFLSGLVSLSPSPLHTAYVFAFGAGMVIGLLGFARVIGWLFDRYASLTLAAMIGLMLGCLRVIWPFKIGDAAIGHVENVMPSADMLLPWPLLGALLGFAIVALLTVIELRARARGERAGIEEVHDAN